MRAATWLGGSFPGSSSAKRQYWESAAIATVTLTQPSRFWCAQGRALNAYLAANPDARHALEHGFNVSLREKLEAMNRAAAPA